MPQRLTEKPKTRSEAAKAAGTATVAWFATNELVERVARHIHEAFRTAMPSEADTWDRLPKQRKNRYFATARELLKNPPPGFKRV